MFYDLVEPAKSEPKTGTVESKPKQPRKAKPERVRVLLGSLKKEWVKWAKGYKGTWTQGQEPPRIEPIA